MKQILLFILLIVGLGLQAQTTHTVINTNDSGLGSLRAAADSAVAGDTIRFSPSLIALGSDTIILTTGEIDFGNKGVVIKGLYTLTDSVYISGNNNSRIFSFSSAGRIVLDSLVLIEGNGTGTTGSGNGGAVYSINCSDTLFVENSKVSGNTASIGDGGGFFSSAYYTSAISVKNSIISGNTAFSGGGGIYSNSSYSSFVNVTNSKISGNTASNGGGIYSEAPSSPYFMSSSSISVTNSTISGNIASTGGGGIYSSASSPTSANTSISVTNSTISGNTASTGGGGIYSYSTTTYFYSSSVSFVNVKNSTISGNTASSGSGGGIYSYCSSSVAYTSNSSSISIVGSTITGNMAFTYGGGIYSYSTTTSSSSTGSYSTVSVTNSTISGNTASTYGGGVYTYAYSYSNIYSSTLTFTSSIIAENGSNNSGIYNSTVPTIISNGYNIFSGIPTGIVGSDSTNISATQLNLQGLAFNGGITQTKLPGVGSIAIDNGNPNDSSDAQNAVIVGIRDVGATEGCFALPTSIYVTACNSYSVPSGNYVYTQSGVYSDTVTTNCGADSVITINLSMVPQYTIIDTIVTCSSYTWIDGVTYTSSNNMAVDTLVSSSGCDSIVTLDLTINQPSSGTAIIVACDSYSCT